MTDETREKIHLVANIVKKNPLNISKYDWGDITDGFEVEAMTELLSLINDENVADKIVACIIKAWDEAYDHDDPICYNHLMDGRERLKYNLRYTLDYEIKRIRQKLNLSFDQKKSNETVHHLAIDLFEDIQKAFISGLPLAKQKELNQLAEEINEMVTELEQLKADKNQVEEQNGELSFKLAMLEVDYEQLKEENEKLKTQQKEVAPSDELESMRNDLLAFQTMDKKGKASPMFTSKQMAIFMKAFLLKFKSLTNNVKELAPLLQKFGGWTEDTAINALGYKATPEECEELAKKFQPYAPKISNIISNFPTEYDNYIKQKKIDNIKK